MRSSGPAFSKPIVNDRTGSPRSRELRPRTTADIAHHRHIASQPTLDRLLEQALELVNQRASVGHSALRAGVGKVEVPIAFDLDPAVADLQIMARGERLDPIEEGAGRPRAEEVEEVVDSFRVGSRANESRSQERLDLRPPEQPAIAFGVVKRAYADTVAAEDQGSTGPVPERNGELAARLLEHPLAEVLVEMDPSLGVTARRELVAARQQVAAKFGILEKFAVERHPDRLVFVSDRLSPTGQVNDGKPTRPEGETWLEVALFVVGSAVSDGGGHREKAALRKLSGSRQINRARDSAHEGDSSGFGEERRRVRRNRSQGSLAIGSGIDQGTGNADDHGSDPEENAAGTKFDVERHDFKPLLG